jgi:hypothetical protein
LANRSEFFVPVITAITNGGTPLVPLIQAGVAVTEQKGFYSVNNNVVDFSMSFKNTFNSIGATTNKISVTATTPTNSVPLASSTQQDIVVTISSRDGVALSRTLPAVLVVSAGSVSIVAEGHLISTSLNGIACHVEVKGKYIKM